MQDESGTTLVETIVGITLLMVVAVGIIQVALLLYARNVIRSSAHEVARSAIERGVAEAEATAMGATLVRESLGTIVDDVQVQVDARDIGSHRLVAARVDAVLHPPGVLPIEVPVRSFVRLRGTAEPR